MTTNPYESPRTPPEPGEGPEMPKVTGRDAGLFVVGMLACGVITLVGAVIAAIMVSAVMGDSSGIAALVVFLNSPAVIGPIAGVVLWARRAENEASVCDGGHHGWRRGVSNGWRVLDVDGRVT